MGENKSLRLKLNDRPLNSQIEESNRKIDELEQIIQMLK